MSGITRSGDHQQSWLALARYIRFVKQLLGALQAANRRSTAFSNVEHGNPDRPGSSCALLLPSSGIFLVEQPHITMQLDEDAVVNQIPARYFADGIATMLSKHSHVARCATCAAEKICHVCPEALNSDKTSTTTLTSREQRGAIFIGVCGVLTCGCVPCSSDVHLFS